MAILKLLVIAGDRSGPYYHTYAIPNKYLNEYKLMECSSTDWLSMDAIATNDIVEMQRQYAPETAIIQRNLKRMGKCTVFHCDDNVWEIPPGNPAKETYKPGSAVMHRYELLISRCDAVTTSTPYLAEWCRKFNPNVYVMRNLVEVDFITSFQNPGRDNPDEIRIGWTGTPHHHDDIQIVEPAIKEIMGKYPKVKWVFMGYAPTDKGVLHANLGRWEYYEFVRVDAFYAAFANMDFDIGIAPLCDNPFNKGKTARKAQEYATLKIPMVLSPMVCYKDWVHGETCLKPKNNQVSEWVKDLDWMITHKADRKAMADRAYEQVVRNHDVKRWVFERADIYKEIYNKFLEEKK